MGTLERAIVKVASDQINAEPEEHDHRASQQTLPQRRPLLRRKTLRLARDNLGAFFGQSLKAAGRGSQTASGPSHGIAF